MWALPTITAAPGWFGALPALDHDMRFTGLPGPARRSHEPVKAAGPAQPLFSPNDPGPFRQQSDAGNHSAFPARPLPWPPAPPNRPAPLQTTSSERAGCSVLWGLSPINQIDITELNDDRAGFHDRDNLEYQLHRPQ
jgi:hypothetical protein